VALIDFGASKSRVSRAQLFTRKSGSSPPLGQFTIFIELSWRPSPRLPRERTVIRKLYLVMNFLKVRSRLVRVLVSGRGGFFSHSKHGSRN